MSTLVSGLSEIIDLTKITGFFSTSVFCLPIKNPKNKEKIITKIKKHKKTHSSFMFLNSKTFFPKDFLNIFLFLTLYKMILTKKST